MIQQQQQKPIVLGGIQNYGAQDSSNTNTTYPQPRADKDQNDGNYPQKQPVEYPQPGANPLPGHYPAPGQYPQPGQDAPPGQDSSPSYVPPTYTQDVEN